MVALLLLFSSANQPTISQVPFAGSFGTSIPYSPNATTYSFGWGGDAIPVTHENDTVFQKFWLNEGMRSSLSAGSSFWVENATGSTTSCTVPWEARLVSLFALADKYGVTISIQVPPALTNYGDPTPKTSGYAYLATNGYKNQLTTYNRFGQVAYGYLRPDTPLLSNQIYNDLIAMNQCFGRYKSWVGISQSYNSADHGGYDWSGPALGNAGEGTHGMGTATIHNWLRSPFFYTPGGNDTATYNLVTDLPKVSPTSVYNNINAYHQQEFNEFLAWNDYNQVQLALNHFKAHTGRALVYVDYDHEGIDRIYGFSPDLVKTLFSNITSVVLSGSELCEVNQSSCISSIMSSLNPGLANDETYMFTPGQCSVTGIDVSKQTLHNYMFLYAYMGAMNAQLQVDSSQTSCSGLQNTGSNEFTLLSSYGVILNRMNNIGSFFGVENPRAPRILLVYQATGANANVGAGAAQFLASANFNVTITNDMNLTGIALSQYNTVLYRPYPGMTGGATGGVLTPYATAAVSKFVSGGGGLVSIPGNINALWSSSSWNKNWSSVFGVRASTLTGYLSGGAISVGQPGSPLLVPYGATVTSGGYLPGSAGGSSTGTLVYSPTTSSVNVVISSSNLGPEVWTNTYGLGKVVMLPGGSSLSTLYGMSSFDAYWTLVENALSFASNNGASGPAIWYPTFLGGTLHEPWDQSTMYSILGSTGNGVLVWLFTNKTGGDAISIRLNGPSFGISTNGWVEVDARDWNVLASGTGSVVSITATLPSKGWLPVYILSKAGSGQFLYSNLKYAQSNVGSNSVRYTFSGPAQFSSWAIVQLAAAPSSVVSSNTGKLAQYSTLTALNRTVVGMSWNGKSWQNLTQSGWYYDSPNGLLYVHFRSGSTTSITVGLSSILTTRSPAVFLLALGPIPSMHGTTFKRKSRPSEAEG